ncbi:Pentapeptide repeats (8 copies) [compost metagenome]
MIGTRWNACAAEGANFRYSLLTDADFRHADLRGAVFDYCSGQGYSQGLHRMPGLLGLQFDHANLEGASFVEANLERASFTGANMQGAIFHARDYERYSLSAEQKRVIQWVSDEEEGERNE